MCFLPVCFGSSTRLTEQYFHFDSACIKSPRQSKMKFKNALGTFRQFKRTECKYSAHNNSVVVTIL